MSNNKYNDLFQEADAAFNKQYAEEISKLKGLSKEEIASVKPGTAGDEAYKALVQVVEKASQQNLAQAQLIGNIKALGEVAVKIAKKIPQFATLL